MISQMYYFRNSEESKRLFLLNVLNPKTLHMSI